MPAYLIAPELWHNEKDTGEENHQGPTRAGAEVFPGEMEACRRALISCGY